MEAEELKKYTWIASKYYKGTQKVRLERAVHWLIDQQENW